MEKAQLTDEQRVLAWKNVSVLRQIYVAEEGENWRETLADVMETYVTKSALANSGIDDMPKDDLEERLEKYKNGHWLYGGTPDEVIEQLTPFAEMGISNLMCWMNFGHIDDKLMRASMKRFADKVMPVLRDIKPKDDKINELLSMNPEKAVSLRQWQR
jgi:alkanesulfonate monooxygenase SsuD/methylene tetrahydromethanopterin reductase-like flavin-dependent oxidoreductase (luciferase family)